MTPRAMLQPMSFFSTGSRGSYSIFCNSSISFASACGSTSGTSSGGNLVSSVITTSFTHLAGQGRFDPMEKDPGNPQSYPDDESEETEDVNRRQPADPLFPEFSEVGNHPDGKEGEDKEQDPEGIHPRHRGVGRFQSIGRMQADEQHNDEGDYVAQNELGKSLPDFARLDAATDAFDLGAPDDSQDEGPDPDEDVDEDLHGSGGHHHPALFVVDPFHGQGLGADQGVHDGAGGHRGPVGLHCQAHPGPRHQGFGPEKDLGQ